MTNYKQTAKNYQQSQLSYVSVKCSVSRFLAHSLKWVSFLQKFQEVISSLWSLKKIFVTSKTIHEVQILSGLMANLEKNLKWHLLFKYTQSKCEWFFTNIYFISVHIVLSTRKKLCKIIWHIDTALYNEQNNTQHLDSFWQYSVVWTKVI